MCQGSNSPLHVIYFNANINHQNLTPVLHSAARAILHFHGRKTRSLCNFFYPFTNKKRQPGVPTQIKTANQVVKAFQLTSSFVYF